MHYLNYNKYLYSGSMVEAIKGTEKAQKEYNENRYDRQEGFLGGETMGKLVKLRIFIQGLRGVIPHFSKNFFLIPFTSKLSLVLKSLRTSFLLVSSKSFFTTLIKLRSEI